MYNNKRPSPKQKKIEARRSTAFTLRAIPDTLLREGLTSREALGTGQ